MGRLRLISAVAFAMAAVFIFGAYAAPKKNKKTNSFETPDFAYPKTVEKNAALQLEKALKSGDGVMALRAAIQANIGRTLVSDDSYPRSLALYDSLSRVLPAPCSDLALLLEASLYRDIYQSNPWTFSRRELPAGKTPENVLEWNKELFASMIQKLVGEAMAHSGNYADMPLSSLGKLVDCPVPSQKYAFSVADFMMFRAVDLLSGFSDFQSEEKTIIPFGTGKDNAPEPPATDSGMRYIEEAIARHAADPDVESELCAFRMSRLYGDARTAAIIKYADQFDETPYGVRFLDAWCNLTPADLGVKTDNEAKRLKLTRIENYIKAYPDAVNIVMLQRKADAIRQVAVEVSFPSDAVPGKEIKATATASNLYDFTAVVVALPAKLCTDGNNPYVRYSSVIAQGRVLHKIPVKLSGETPDEVTGSFSIPALSSGFYAVIPTTDGKLDSSLRKRGEETCSVMNVSDIMAVGTQYSLKDGNYGVYVISASDGQPVRGAEVTFRSTKYHDGSVTKAVTDANGLATTTLEYFRYVAVKDGSYALSYGSRANKYTSEARTAGSVLTDLSLYRPGQKVGFACIAYLIDAAGHTLEPLKRGAVEARLYDANYNPVDTISLTTDDFGRCSGEFTLPRNGLLGEYRITMSRNSIDVASSGFEVAEYKLPTFFVTAESAVPSYAAGDSIKLSGKAVTYTGMPVGNAKVRYTVTYNPMWWWCGDSSQATYGGETNTDVSGNFLIDLPTAALKGTRYVTGRYSVSVEVTDASGETQRASADFSMGNTYSISADVPELIALGQAKERKISVKVSDAIGRPAVRKVWYTLRRDSLDVARGSFDSPTFLLPLARLTPGEYQLRFSLSEEALAADSAAAEFDAQVVSSSFIAYNPNSKTPLPGRQLWVPETEIVVPANVGTVDIPVGSSCDPGYILAEISDDSKVLKREWIRRDNLISAFNVTTPDRDKRIFVTFLDVCDRNVRSATVTLIPEYQRQNLKIETVTFRDKIAPGAAENWKFRFYIDEAPCANIPVFAVMSDKALDEINPFSWNFNPYGNLYWGRTGRYDYPYVRNFSNSFDTPLPVRKGKMAYFNEPEWNLYGMSLYGGGTRYHHYGLMRNAALSSAQIGGNAKYKMEEEAVTMDSVAAEAVEDEAFELPKAAPTGDSGALGEGGGGLAGKEKPSVIPREKEHPLAFFMPDLVTDAEGYVEIPFTAPDFIGTWQLQVAGYNKDMKGAVSVLDAVAAKKVMAQLNAPRFLRTGDSTLLMATLYNNSDSTLLLSGKIEIADGVTGKTLAVSDVTAGQVAPSGSRVIRMDYTVPSDVSVIAVTAYGFGGDATDGEVVAVPVLPSSKPMVESTPFYLGADKSTLSVRLPKFDKDARLTLQYCANPVWECVTALPGIARPNSVSALVQADALYADALASGLFSRYPRLADCIREMALPENAADSTLVSPLQKNGALKTVKLNDTPWVNSASSETDRMRSLLEYADPSNAASAISAILKDLGDLRNSDGGWCWCPGPFRESSEFVTEAVLTRLAALNSLGFMPEETEKWIKPGFRFCDSELAREWQKNKRKYFSTEGLLDYLFVKSSFKGVGATSSFAALDLAAMKKIKSDWADFDIYHKATAALLLARRGDRTTASRIMESLRQFASSDEAKGVWFDNLRSSWSGCGRLLTTARVLEAFAELQPDSPMVDGIRQWLVLSKQTQDWGADSNLSAVTSAILSSGSDWTAETTLPKITLGGKEILPSRAAGLTGAFTLNLTAEETSDATLTVEKSGAAPSWGGVVAQFVAPIRDVKAAEIPQLSIRKEVYSLLPGKEGYIVTDSAVNVGDRIRVTLFITADRDLDYVAVTDFRAACLEPAEQISEYSSSDGVYYYKEVRDQATNLFIRFLPKGTHVVSYDCYADREGVYSLGIATAQSQYAPVITAHSAGAILTVAGKE